jgi:tRNA A37 methylthiotransferase MiaB
VLIESRDGDHPQRFSGRSEQNELVHVDAPDGVDPRGSIVAVRVLEAFKHSLYAVMDGAAARPGLRVSKPKKVLLPLASA